MKGGTGRDRANQGGGEHGGDGVAEGGRRREERGRWPETKETRYKRRGGREVNKVLSLEREGVILLVVLRHSTSRSSPSLVPETNLL